MKTILLVPLRDYYQSRKRIWVKYLIPVVLGLLALAGALIFNIGNEETIRSTFSEFVNVQINVVAILVSFSVAIISILVTADNANTKSLKEEMADSTQYKPVGGKHLSLFQILLCLGVVPICDTADTVREHPLKGNGLLGRPGNAVVPLGFLHRSLQFLLLLS